MLRPYIYGHAPFHHPNSPVVCRRATFFCGQTWRRWMAIRRKRRTPSSPESWAFVASRCGRECSTGIAGCRATGRIMRSMSRRCVIASAGCHPSRSPERATTAPVSRRAYARGARRRVLCFGDYPLNGESELFIDPLIGRRCAKSVDSDDHTALTHPAIPGLGGRRLDRDATHTGREHRVPVALRLLREKLEAGHRNSSWPPA